ncbi:MAG: hypothetical protein JWM83_1536 [Candidatus Angelobacter sp.]|nr:hypothetical protein [Candidatus Angelobacter sp.]
MEIDHLKRTFKEAAVIAAELPESMHSAAFSKAVDVLLSTGRNSSVIKKPVSSRRHDEPSSNAKKKSTSRLGPKAAVMELLNGDFLVEFKSAAAIQSHLKMKRGLDYLVDEVAMACLRLVREEALERDKSESGQYVYKKC